MITNDMKKLNIIHDPLAILYGGAVSGHSGAFTTAMLMLDGQDIEKDPHRELVKRLDAYNENNLFFPASIISRMLDGNDENEKQHVSRILKQRFGVASGEEVEQFQNMTGEERFSYLKQKGRQAVEEMKRSTQQHAAELKDDLDREHKENGVDEKKGNYDLKLNEALGALPPVIVAGFSALPHQLLFYPEAVFRQTVKSGSFGALMTLPGCDGEALEKIPVTILLNTEMFNTAEIDRHYGFSKEGMDPNKVPLLVIHEEMVHALDSRLAFSSRQSFREAMAKDYSGERKEVQEKLRRKYAPLTPAADTRGSQAAMEHLAYLMQLQLLGAKDTEIISAFPATYLFIEQFEKEVEALGRGPDGAQHHQKLVEKPQGFSARL